MSSATTAKKSTPTTSTGLSARLASRANSWPYPTSTVAPGFVQANLIALPASYASDFALLCARNPVSCPLIARSSTPGDPCSFVSCIPGVPDSSIFSSSIDIRTDVPFYRIYTDGKPTANHVSDVTACWDSSTEPLVAFLIGCSFSFDSALAAAGLTPPHAAANPTRNVPMYRTTLPLWPAGFFASPNLSSVVSVRVYPEDRVETVRDITRRYTATHGEPLAWGWDSLKRLGIQQWEKPEFGDPPVDENGASVCVEDAGDRVPVFWGCGVTPQEAAMKAGVQGTVIAHEPGFMLVLDLKEEEITTQVSM